MIGLCRGAASSAAFSSSATGIGTYAPVFLCRSLMVLAVVGAPRQAQQIALPLSGVDCEQHCQPQVRRCGFQEARDLFVVPNLVDASAVIKLAALGAWIGRDQSAIMRPRKNPRQRAISIVSLPQGWVKTLLIDTVGCGIGAWDEKPVRICREVALSVDGPATIIGTDRRTTADLAAFANGAAFRYLDFNDTYVGRFAVHPSDNIAACLAVAEEERASIREVITAIVIAYEVNCRLVDAFDISKRGWDPPVFGLPAVALAAGRLMRLDPDQLTHAVNLAINDHIPMAQTRVGALSNWKGLAAAEAGRNAVFAARLARAGLTGPAPIFEGSSGFFQQVAGPANVNVEAFGRRGVQFRIHQCSLKPYPAVIYTQTAAVAGIEIAKEVGSLNRISAIEIATTRRGYERTGSEPEKWSPKTRETADHSLPYITARAMFDGDITNESFAPEKFRDPAVLAFMQKIKVGEDPALTARVGGAVHRNDDD